MKDVTKEKTECFNTFLFGYITNCGSIIAQFLFIPSPRSGGIQFPPSGAVLLRQVGCWKDFADGDIRAMSAE